MSLGILGMSYAKVARPLGADSGAWTWKNQTPNTQVQAFQTWVNGQLKKYGYYPISVDGKLGPGTCGAGLHLLNYHGDVDWSPPAADAYLNNANVCQGWTYPTKVGNTKPEVNTFAQASSPDTAALPWATQSDKTVAAQQQVNTHLVAHDYLPLAVDGKLGAGTCGAMKQLDAETGSSFLFNYGKNCQAFTAPTKKPPTSTPIVPTTPTGPVTTSPGPTPPEVLVSASKPKVSTATMVTGLAVLGVLGIAYAKHKGMI